MKKEYELISDIKITSPDIVFADKLLFALGGINCVIERVGGDHSPDSTVIYVAEEGVLFLGDCWPLIYMLTNGIIQSISLAR